MPLLLLYGKPNSGKSELATQVQDLSSMSTKVVSPDSLSFTPEEQVKRQIELFRSIYSFVQQFLNDETLVIVDCTNHTKSFRYELFCVARERKTRFAVLVSTNEKGPNEKWAEDIYLNLVSRQEQILEKSEWDNPNFIAAEECVEYLMKKSDKIVKRATQIKRQINVSIAVFLNNVCQKIISMQRVTDLETTVQVCEGVYFDCKKIYSVDELQLCKTEFIKFWMDEHRNNQENIDMGTVFVEWLSKIK
ncbi:Chromatin associated protein KTI12 [Spironucleus salmonicida]|uniref:Chromatin associated protein KTI12 n=1 Tax=Spironucleus salmonicida TaxID=348837 RepID=V6LML2_9EUKA|nr:Chromatin associated protein KTI12 [Spironucleus salmonicida]|eukprot:EST41954.1 Chromatin associated protein KTI12 [Spironucleus salmonicida]